MFRIRLSVLILRVGTTLQPEGAFCSEFEQSALYIRMVSGILLIPWNVNTPSTYSITLIFLLGIIIRTNATNYGI